MIYTPVTFLTNREYSIEELEREISNSILENRCLIQVGFPPSSYIEFEKVIGKVSDYVISKEGKIQIIWELIDVPFRKLIEPLFSTGFTISPCGLGKVDNWKVSSYILICFGIKFGGTNDE